MTNILNVVAYTCEGDDDDEEEERLELVGRLDEDSLQEQDQARRICTNMVETVVYKKQYNADSVKNARIHEWTEENRTESLPGITQSAEELLNAFRQGEDLEENARKMARAYLEEDRSANDLLLFTRYERDGLEEPFVGIIKTPYIEDANDTDLDEDDQVFVENDHVIEEEVDKSVLYPRYTPEGLNTRKAELFQKNGGSHWANYWYGFLNMRPADHPDEVLKQSTSAYLEESETEKFEGWEEFTNYVDEELEEYVEDDEDAEEVREQGTISVKFRNKRFRVSLGELERGEVQFAKQGENYYAILSDPNPTFEVGTGSRMSFVEELSDLPDVDQLFDG